MTKITFLLTAGLLSIVSAHGQKTVDSTKIELQPVQVKVYFAKQSLLGLTTSSHVLSAETITQQANTTLLTAVNTVPGVRMEERSPGSYRLAMRGSMIRSPFGVRNSKIYIDEFPLTDAGGNTYFNLIAPVGIHAIQVIKGPDGSLFGANSGGVLKLTPKGFEPTSNSRQVELSAGSYGLFQQTLSLQQNVGDNYQFSVDQAILRSDGYRDHSGMNKKTIQTAHQWQYDRKGQLRFFGFYTDMGYQTPGGLNASQYADNPKASRPAAGPILGAKEQRAAIYNKTGYLGLSNQYQITDQLYHQVALFGSYTDFENPFITNYETRIEKNWGIRTYLSLQGKNTLTPWQMQLGFEGIKGTTDIVNYDNNQGIIGDLQARDDLSNTEWNLFYRTQLELLKGLILEGSIGLNGSVLDYNKRNSDINIKPGQIAFKKQWMPRFASSYSLNELMSWRMSISRGYSTPTIAEIRSSDNKINPELQAESGLNYEMGYKVKTRNSRLIADIAAYTYQMKNGIVRSLNENGAEYYQNAGEMNQKGIEFSLWSAIPIKPANPYLKRLNWHTALSYNSYKFGTYKVADKDYSGNLMTAVPKWIWTNTLQFQFPHQLGLNIYHNYTASMPLDDANTVFSEKFHLVQAKLMYNLPLFKHIKIEVYAGADNLLDQKYSLGNDINAFGGRYFNAAPRRNYYGGSKFTF